MPGPMRSAASSMAIFGESIYGPTKFGVPTGNDANVFSDLFSMGDLGADEQKYADRARSSYANFMGYLARIGKIASAGARDTLTSMITGHRKGGSMATNAEGVLTDVRESEKYTPPNPFVWSRTHPKQRADQLRKDNIALLPLIDNAEKTHGILPPEQTRVVEVIRTVVVERPAPPPPQPLPVNPPGSPQGPKLPPAQQQPTPTDQKQAAGVTPGWVMPVAIGGIAAVGLGLWYFLKRK